MTRGSACTLGFLLALLPACSSGESPGGGGACDPAACPKADAGPSPAADAAIVHRPTTVDGGISAPCTDSSQCSEGLMCLDGACFD